MSKLLFGISSPSFNLFLFASFSLFRIKNMGQLRPIFLFSSFSHYNSTLNWKKQSVDDVVLAIRTLDRIMIGTDGSPELWQPLFFHILTSDFFCKCKSMNFFLKNYILMGSGCGWVGRVVTSDTRAPPFQSSHLELILPNIFTVSVCKT